MSASTRTRGRKKKAPSYDFANCETRLVRDGPYHKEDVIAAIYETHGDWTQMAVLLGRRRNAVRSFVLANLDVKDVYDEVNESLLDAVENTHRLLALGGDGPACRFILETIGKDRGYTKRVEQTGKGGGPIEAVVTADWSKLTTEQLRAVRSAIVDKQ